MATKIKQPENIVKRDGRIVSFDKQKIENAMVKCFSRINIEPKKSFKEMTNEVINIISAKNDGIPTVEEIQDIVEIVLFASSEYQAAKEYILYRSEHNKSRDGREVPDYIKETFQDSVQYFPTDIQQFQFYDKYSRYNYEYGRRETWAETVRRTVSFLRELSKDKLDKNVYKEIEKYILEMKSSPSMRMLAMAGEAAKINNISIYNCSYLPVDCIDAFVEMLIISMSGSGVGYSVESQYTENLPRIKRRDKTHPIRFIVPDSSAGWAEALRLGLTTWFNGGDVVFDYSLIRPSGSPLKTKGGRASGPDPLVKMMNFIKAKLQKRQGSFLHPLDAHDIMCIIGDASIQGGSRRTALICLFDFGDMEMRQCKNGDNINGNEQRWNANNSEVWPERELTQEEVTDFMLDMIKSGRGESGIFNRMSARNTRPERRQDADFGTNPCFTYDSLLLTENGYQEIGSLNNKKINIINAKGEIVNGKIFKSGTKETISLNFSNKQKIKCTPNHIFMDIYGNEVEAIDSKGVQIAPFLNYKKFKNFYVLLGFIQGDGGLGRLKSLEHLGIELNMGDKDNDIYSLLDGRKYTIGERRVYLQDIKKDLISLGFSSEKLPQREFPLSYNSWNLEDKAAFLRGCFSANGTINNYARICYKTTCKNFVLQLQETLENDFEIGSFITTNKSHDVLFSNGNYTIKESYDLNISAFEDKVKFNNEINFHQEYKIEKLANQLIKTSPFVRSIKNNGINDVYDFSLPEYHWGVINGFISHNCGEILLRKNSFCNLSAAVAREDDTLESLSKKVEIASIIGTIQSMATDFPGLRPIWKQNCEEERLLGVDINGQMDSAISRDPLAQQHFKEVAIETNKKYAEILGIPQSAAVTCIKPSGNSSQLYNTSSGLHARHSKYYIRNIRVSALTPMYKVIRDSGVPMSPENGQTKENATKWVIPFPVKSPDDAILKEHTSALDQCNYWLQVKKNYTEHNPSVTISYKDNEILDLIKWVWKNQKYVGGMSFLPYFDAKYDLMPYQEIDEEEYIRRKAEFPTIDFSKIYKYELEDFTTASQELACVSGVCEVP